MLPARKNQDWLPSIFNDFFGNEWLVKPNFSTPAINVVETEKEYRVEVAAPGMTKDDFKINLDDENNLTINVEKKEEKKRKRRKNTFCVANSPIRNSNSPSPCPTIRKRRKSPPKSNMAYSRSKYPRNRVRKRRYPERSM